MSENKPSKDYVLMLLHWGLTLVICFASVFIQYLFVTYTRNKAHATQDFDLFKINYVVYIIGVSYDSSYHKGRFFPTFS